MCKGFRGGLQHEIAWTNPLALGGIPTWNVTTDTAEASGHSFPSTCDAVGRCVTSLVSLSVDPAEGQLFHQELVCSMIALTPWPETSKHAWSCFHDIFGVLNPMTLAAASNEFQRTAATQCSGRSSWNVPSNIAARRSLKSDLAAGLTKCRAKTWQALRVSVLPDQGWPWSESSYLCQIRRWHGPWMSLTSLKALAAMVICLETAHMPALGVKILNFDIHQPFNTFHHLWLASNHNCKLIVITLVPQPLPSTTRECPLGIVSIWHQQWVIIPLPQNGTNECLGVTTNLGKLMLIWNLLFLVSSRNVVPPSYCLLAWSPIWLGIDTPTISHS